jgi:hypothetical protein
MQPASVPDDLTQAGHRLLLGQQLQHLVPGVLVVLDEHGNGGGDITHRCTARSVRVRFSS